MVASTNAATAAESTKLVERRRDIRRAAASSPSASAPDASAEVSAGAAFVNG